MKRLLIGTAAAAVLVAMSTSTAFANHSWNGYHWATRGTAFTLTLGNDLTTTEWRSDLGTVSSKWSASSDPKNRSVLSTTIAPGNDIGTQKRCPPTSGRVEVCNASYGKRGWLGVATIWVTSAGHIVQGTVKVNDTYLGPTSTYTYNNAQERLHVICQEVGHTFGLDHQDTSGATFGTCMDYYHNTSSTDALSTLPDQGDYDQLACIYNKTYNGSTLSFAGQTSPYQAPHTCRGTGHDDGTTTVGAPGFSPAAAKLPAWANPSRDVYITHLRNGLTQVSFVRWATRP
jgi:hypothetical protein